MYGTCVYVYAFTLHACTCMHVWYMRVRMYLEEVGTDHALRFSSDVSMERTIYHLREEPANKLSERPR